MKQKILNNNSQSYDIIFLSAILTERSVTAHFHKLKWSSAKVTWTDITVDQQ